MVGVSHASREVRQDGLIEAGVVIGRFEIYSMTSGPPVFEDPAGTFAVDYRDHNGTIILGDGSWRFTTQWSTAGNGSIHAYRDGGPQLAVARGASSIEDVTAAVFAESNFSSRTRTPHEGEVVLWLNDKGFAAAVEIRKVTITAESLSGTVLEGRYRILVNQGRDFSAAPTLDTDELKQAVQESLRAFDALVDIDAKDQDVTEVGIGHNRPPADLILKKDDFLPTATELRALSLEPKSEHRLRRTYDAVTTALKKLAAAIARRFQLVEEGFYRQIGASTTLGLIAWLTFTGKLEKVEQAITAVGAKLFGW